MKSFIKEFLTNLLKGLMICIVILILIGIEVLILSYTQGILQVVLILLYPIILISLFKTILDKFDEKEIIDN